MEARFTHDCDACRFLDQHNQYDLYFCACTRSLVARESNEPSNYKSMPLRIAKLLLDQKDLPDPYTTILDLAYHAGLIDKDYNYFTLTLHND